jgi:excisionase family DNA binding protein
MGSPYTPFMQSNKSSVTLAQAVDAQLLTVAQVATLLSISLATTYRLIRTGQIASVHLGRSIRVPSSEVPDFIKRNLRSLQSEGL